ncbi:MAG: hypothetical protein L0323_04735 [Planctomycetes bacterium]|nr:hypothetical protein [Planctomycetota bacterium]
MPDELQRLVRWVSDHFQLVVFVVVLASSVLLPIFKKAAEARERAARKERGPRGEEETFSTGPGGEPEEEGPAGPRDFDWGKWLEEMQQRSAGEAPSQAGEKPAPKAPPRAQPRSLEEDVEEEGKPVWDRRPLTEAGPLSEARPLRKAEPLTKARSLERAPLSKPAPLTEAVPLTELAPYAPGAEPEPVGTLEPGRVETVGDSVYVLDMPSEVTTLDRPAAVSSIEKEKPSTPAAAALPVEVAALIRIPTDPHEWSQAFVVSEVLGRPAALREPEEGVAPGLR